MKTILITGSSTGIGFETALFFAKKGWRVFASMRNPEQAVEALKNLENIHLIACDVTSGESVQKAFQTVRQAGGALDVVVNNAGYGLATPFTDATDEQIQRQYETNVIGLMKVSREAIHCFKDQRDGVLINIASVGGRMTFPFWSLYHGTKWAVEGFSEALAYELKVANIRVKIVEPGPIKTDFYTRSMDLPDQIDESSDFARSKRNSDEFAQMTGSKPETVAKVIYRAATDGSRKLRYPAGWMAHVLLASRRWLPSRFFNWFVGQVVLR